MGTLSVAAAPVASPPGRRRAAQADLVSWHGTGMSVMEMSHRGPEFEGIIAKAEKDLRTLMAIPDNYKAPAQRGRAPPPQPAQQQASALRSRSIPP